MELCVMGGIQQQTEFVKVVVDVIRHSKHCIRRIYLGTDKNSKNDRFLHCLILFNFALKGGVCPLQQGCTDSEHPCRMVKASPYQPTKNKAHRNGFYHPTSPIYSISRLCTALNCIEVWFCTSM